MGEVCAFGWPEGCEYHLPDEYREWCSPCRLRVVLGDVRLDEWVQEHRPEWCYRIDHLTGPDKVDDGCELGIAFDPCPNEAWHNR